jgi:hypothetical protein
MHLFFLVSWFLAVAVAVLPPLYFLKFGWPAREAEFIDKVRVGSNAMTKRGASADAGTALAPMEEYFRKFWSVGRDEYCRKHPEVSATDYATLFKARYRSLIGIPRYIAPGILFLLVVGVLSGLVVATALRTGYDNYITYYATEAKSEAATATTAAKIGNPITLDRTNVSTLDADFAPLPQLQLSLSPLSAIAGAYLFIVAQLIQQSRARTLVYSDLFGAALRLIVAVPLGLSLSVLASDKLGPFISFGLGAFPIGALSILIRRLTVTTLKADDPRADDDQTVAMLGVTQSVSNVLADENITCAQQLADIDPVVLAVRTGLSFDYVLFLAAQSLVWCFLGKTAITLGPLGFADARAIWYLMRKSDPDTRDDVLKSLDAQFTTLATKDAPKPIDSVLLRQAFEKIAGDPYTIFLLHFTSDLDKPKPATTQTPAQPAELSKPPPPAPPPQPRPAV